MQTFLSNRSRQDAPSHFARYAPWNGELFVASISRGYDLLQIFQYHYVKWVLKLNGTIERPQNWWREKLDHGEPFYGYIRSFRHDRSLIKPDSLLSARGIYDIFAGWRGVHYVALARCREGIGLDSDWKAQNNWRADQWRSMPGFTQGRCVRMTDTLRR